MKTLSLYIEKWYIVGAVSIDGVPHPLQLPNGEDRIWLYFHEDIARDEISYGKGYQSHYRNNENHYYGDVFSLITNSNALYSKHGREQPMEGIFKDANIFDHIRTAIEADQQEKVETYISFSDDIGDGAKLCFSKKLEEENFEIKETVVRIGHLAMEAISHKGEMTQEGFYLVLSACNENLHYALYQRSGDIYVRKAEETLTGLGTDVRRRALVEYVVNRINYHEHLLGTMEEKECECLRLTQQVDSWIDRLAQAENAIPVQITNIQFACNAYRNYDVSAQRNSIDERTASIVEEIVRVITRFVNDHNTIPSGIVMLGTTFTNEQFRTKFKQTYNLSNKKIITYRDEDLYEIVHAYTYINCEQFSLLSKKFTSNGEADMQRIKNAEEEERKRIKAEQDKIETDKTNEEEKARQKRINKQRDLASIAEKEQNYDDLIEALNLLLRENPDDIEEIKDRKEEAKRKKYIQEEALKNYQRFIKSAKEAFDQERWEQAKQKAEEALNCMDNSEEAQRILKESERRIEITKDFEKFITRADSNYDNGEYSKAQRELDFARALDLSPAMQHEVEQREQQIAKTLNQIEQQTRQVKSDLEAAEKQHNYDKAIDLCEQLIEMDSAQSKDWSRKRDKLRDEKTEYGRKQEELAKQKAKVEGLRKAINNAQFNEDYPQMAELCQQLLDIQEDEIIRELLQRTKKRLAETKVVEELNELKELIKNRKYSEAREKMNTIARIGAVKGDAPKAKSLHAMLFEREDKSKPTHPPKNPSTPKDKDNFFVDSTTTKAKNSSTTASNSPKSKPTSSKDKDDFFEDDFFGNVTPSKGSKPTPRTPAQSKTSKTSKTQSKDPFFD